jgi:modulator of FtsH protease HflK
MADKHEHSHDRSHEHHAAGAAGDDLMREQMIGEELDPASRSLADALRASFRVLSVIMVALVAAYLFSGIFRVGPDEAAVVLRFGKLVGARQAQRGEVLKPGAHFSWPAPVDEVVRVSTKVQTLSIDTFWCFVAPGDVGRPIQFVRAGSEGLRPGYDGALMTGDSGLVHVKWTCLYQVAGADAKDLDRAVLDYVSNVADVKAVLEAAVRDASIRVAATMSADEVVQGSSIFSGEVRRIAQGTLDQLGAGIRLQELKYEQTPPLQTLEAFKAVAIASQQEANLVKQAEQEATKKKVASAGEHWADLAGAINEYEMALSEGNADQAQRRYEAINELLERQVPGSTEKYIKGEARRVLNEAQTYRTAVVQKAQQAQDQFLKLLPAYLENHEFTVSRLWAQTMQDILSQPKVIKQYLNGRAPYVLTVTIDPKIIRRLRELEAQEAKKASEATP